MTEPSPNIVDLTTPLAAALHYARRRGWHIFPVPPNTKLSYKSAKNYGGRKWGMTIDPEEIRSDYRQWPDAGVGIVTGPESGIFVVDVDAPEGHEHNGIANFEELQDRYGTLPPTLMARTPSGGTHYYFKWPADVDVRNSTSRIAKGVDIRGHHGIVIAPPTPKTKEGITRRYEYLNELEIADATQWLLDQVAQPPRCERVRPGDANFEDPSLEMIAGVMGAIPNDGSDWEAKFKANNQIVRYTGWDGWNTIMMALWVGTEGSDAGYRIAREWCEKNPDKFEVKETVSEMWYERFPGSPPTRVTVGLLFTIANTMQPDWRQQFEVGNQILELESWLNRDLEPCDFICGDWLTTTSRTIIDADTGIGKTLWALALAMSCAAGLPFMHWRSTRPIRVLYIDGEMSRRVMKERLADAVLRFGLNDRLPAGMYLLSHEDVPDGSWHPLNSPAGHGFIEKIIAHIGGVDLIVFDNIMALISGDQKDEEGWTKALPWIRRLSRRRIAQIWINHTGHDTTRGYGTKTREWQMDNIVHFDKVERADTDVSFNLVFRKARERAPATRNQFVEVKVALVNDQWTWEPSSGIGQQQRRTPLSKKFYEALCVATADSGRAVGGSPAASIEQWKTQCVSMGLIDPQDRPNSARTLLNKARRELIATNWIACNETDAWTLGPNLQGGPM